MCQTNRPRTLEITPDDEVQLIASDDPMEETNGTDH